MVALTLALTLPSYTVYHLTVLPNGSTLWAIEHRFPLSTPDEIEIFKNMATHPENLTSDYSARIDAIASDASRILGRSMSIEGFSVEVETVETVGGKMGLIKIEFTWRGFGKITPTGVIELGDVFIGGFYLSEGETLRIKIPAGFEVEEVRPAPDGRGPDYVEWRGRMVFTDGEPRLVIRPATAQPQGPTQWWGEPVLYYVAGGVAASIPVIYAAYRMRGRRRPQESELDMVIRIIKRHGGVVYQSQIVRESGLSKSTVSTILKVLESEGRVTRVREGRENIVKLIH
ncbi:MAG: MarR family transcriptional regulator [Nitrososphaerota archaeon]